MAAELEILTDNGALELEQGAYKQFYITRQIHDLHDFQTRNSDFSREMQVPPTPQNLDVLRLRQNDTAQVGIPCSVTMGGVTVAPEAVLYYLGTEIVNKIDVLRVQILFGNFNFINSIVISTLDEINWADLALDWIAANCKTISLNTSGIVYALADWSGVGVQPINTRNQDINTDGFFLYAHTIIERIMAASGWSVIYDPAVPADYFKIALACPITKFLEPVDVSNFPLVEEVGITLAPQTVSNAAVRVIFDTVAPNWDTPNNQFIIPATDTFTISFTGSIEHTENGVRPASTYRIYRNASILAEFSTEVPLPAGTPIFLSSEFVANIGDLVYCEMESNDDQTSMTVEIGGIFKLSTSGSEITRTIQPSEWIPKMDAKNFMSSIFNIYNLVITSNDITKEVTLKSFNEIFVNSEQNLTGLVDVNDKIEIEPSLSSIGRNSKFSWLTDNVVRSDFNTTLKFPQGILNQETDVVSLPFGACDDSIYYFISSFDIEPKAKLPNYDLVRTFFVAPDEPTITVDNVNGVFSLNREEEWEVGSWFSYIPAVWFRVIAKTSNTTGILEFPISQGVTPTTLNQILNLSALFFEPRLALMHIDGGGDQAAITNGQTDTITIMDINSHMALWGEELTWDTLIELYYKQLMAALQTPLVINLNMNISILTFAALDHLKPIYIEKYAAFFYLNKLSQFKLNSKTRVELIRISSIKDLE